MNASPLPAGEITIEPASRSACEEPLYFPSERPRLFGWLHGSNLPSERGVVLCKPFGYDSICAHRILTGFARMAAGAGFPTLRFDYVGLGDSADIDERDEQIERWCEDILAAIEELRRRTGVQHVCLLGFRLGALLAALAAARCSAVDALLLVAPVVSGRRYVGEMRALAAASLLYASMSKDAPAQTSAEPGSLEVSGHRLSVKTIEALARVDLAQAALPGVSRLLIIDRNDIPAARGWSRALGQLDIAVEYAALPGFAPMMMVAPHLSRMPQEMLEAARRWLVGFPAPSSGAPSRQPQRALRQPIVPVPETLELPGSESDAGSDCRERAVRFGADGRLFGIVTEPGSGVSPRRHAVILLNAGADVHIAFGRMYVTLARRWARLGFVVLRMDLAGIGDSEPLPGRPENDIFPEAALEDVHAAMNFMRAEYGVTEVTLGGLCAAAYHALRAAAAGFAVNAIIMVNPLNFYWKQGTPYTDVQPADLVRDWETQRTRWSSPAAWKKLLSGKVGLARVRRVAQVASHRIRATVECTLRELARAVHIPLPQDLGRELQDIADRGIKIVFVFGRGEPGIELLRLQGGSVVGRLGERCQIHIIETADHNFAHSGARSMLANVLTSALVARQEPR